MKISDYPKTIEQKEQYTAGEIAILFGVSHRTAAKMIDSGTLVGFVVPGSKERRVLHVDIVTYVSVNPSFKFVLAKIIPQENPQ